MDAAIVIVLAIAQVAAFVVMVSMKPRRPGTGPQQRRFAALCLLAAIAIVVTQRSHLFDLTTTLAVAAFFVVDAAGLAISARKQDRHDFADAEIHEALDGANPHNDS